MVRPIIEGLMRRHHVSAAEVARHDQWQRAVVGVAAVAGSYSHLCQILDDCDRFVWSHPEIDVLSADRRWLDEEG